MIQIVSSKIEYISAQFQFSQTNIDGHLYFLTAIGLDQSVSQVKLVATKGDLYLTGVKFSNLDAAFSDSGFFHGYNIVSDINPYSRISGSELPTLNASNVTNLDVDSFVGDEFPSLSGANLQSLNFESIEGTLPSISEAKFTNLPIYHTNLDEWNYSEDGQKREFNTSSERTIFQAGENGVSTENILISFKENSITESLIDIMNDGGFRRHYSDYGYLRTDESTNSQFNNNPIYSLSKF